MKKVLPGIILGFLLSLVISIGATSVMAVVCDPLDPPGACFVNDSVNVNLNVTGTPPPIIPPSSYSNSYVEMDVDGDGTLERVTDSDGNGANGLDSYSDPNSNSTALFIIDGDFDLKKDFLIDIDGDGIADRYWDPDHGVITTLKYQNVNEDGTFDYLIDSDGDGDFDKMFDTITNQVADLSNYAMRDVDGDGNYDFAIDIDGNSTNGHDTYSDPNGSSAVITNVDVNGDGKTDYLIDTNGDGAPDKYWDPFNNILTNIIVSNQDADGYMEYLIDIDGNAVSDKYYDLQEDKFYNIGGDIIYADVDSDGNLEEAINADGSSANGYESYNDPDGSSDAIYSKDIGGYGLQIQAELGDPDGNTDFMIDTNKDGVPDVYWDPVHIIITPILKDNLDIELGKELMLDTMGTGKYDKYLDPKDGIVYDISGTIFKDINGDGVYERAIDLDGNPDNGYEVYKDLTGLTTVIFSGDINGDGEMNYLIDIDGDGTPDKYWDPSNRILTNVISGNMDDDPFIEFLVDVDGDGNYDKYYDDETGEMHDIPQEEDEPEELVEEEDTGEESETITVEDISLPVSMSLTTNKGSAIANGSDAIFVTVSVKDSKGNTPKGLKIKLISGNSQDVITPEYAITDEKGSGRFTVKSNVPHTSVLKAAPWDTTMSHISETATVNFTQYVEETTLITPISGFFYKLREQFFLIRNDPKVEGFVNNTVAPVGVIVVIAIGYFSLISLISSLSDIFPILNYIITSLLQVSGIKRRPKPWGTIYDSETKEPIDLAIVRMIDAKTNQVVQTQVTDKMGRFSFVPRDGKYIISVTKSKYDYPSKLLKGSKTDKIYSNLYFGQAVMFSSARFTNYSIPLDNYYRKDKKAKASLRDTIKSIMDSVSIYVLIAGLLISVFSLWIDVNSLNIILAVAYIALILIKDVLMAPPPKPAATLLDAKTNRPISGVAVKIFDSKYDKLLSTKVSDKKGFFNFLLPPGKYYLRVSNSKYTVNEKAKGNYYLGEEFEINGGKPIRMRIPLIQPSKV